MKRIILFLAAVSLSLFFTGCTTMVGYNPTYLPQDAAKLNLPGKSLVVMTDADAQWVYSGSPSTFTASATTLNIPMGEITKQVALRVFGAAFQEGADFRNSTTGSQGYRLVVEPKVASFTYAYKQLHNLGFAITPTVTVDLRVKLTAPDGQVLLERTYVSGPVEGASYALSGAPQEKINQLLHQTLFKLMTDAALEVRGKLAN